VRYRTHRVRELPFRAERQRHNAERPAEERGIEIAELLLRRGLDPELTDADGMTAADVALKSGFDELAELLREPRRPDYKKV
jgi:ankyrin repeat protein